jgi:hypothetical protein
MIEEKANSPRGERKKSKEKKHTHKSMVKEKV